MTSRKGLGKEGKHIQSLKGIASNLEMKWERIIMRMNATNEYESYQGGLGGQAQVPWHFTPKGVEPWRKLCLLVN